MKKLSALLIIFLAMATSGFAYQQTIYATPPVNNAGTSININGTCSYIQLSCSWNSFFGDYSGGAAVAYGDDRLIGEYSFTYGSNASSYSNTLSGSLYWTTVQMIINAYNCYGQATLTWVP